MSATLRVRPISDKDILLELRQLRDKLNTMELDPIIDAADTTATLTRLHYIVVIKKLMKILNAIQGARSPPGCGS